MAKTPQIDTAAMEAKLSAFKVEVVPIDFLRPNSWNPNRQTPDEFEKLKRSIIENGFSQPVVCALDGEIIDGFHRWKACKELGFGKIAVIKSDLNEFQRKLATIQFNEARGTEDMELLGKMMKDFEALGMGDLVKDQLSLDTEGFQRLLEYEGTVLDVFPGDHPGAAWEPQPTQTGQVENFRSEDGTEAQSVSKAANAPAEESANSSVPGLGKHDPGYKAPDVVLVRRIFVLTKEQAEGVDRVLGKEAASRLVEICVQIEKGDSL